MSMLKNNLSFLMVILGVAFEHFDMLLMSLLASSIVSEFVGVHSPQLNMIYGFVGYSIAFFFRPLGAFCFGCMGDLYGRKTAILGSMLLMSGVTLGLAFVPGYQAIGMASTVLFLLCRIGQGLAVGGEYGTAMTYAFEFNEKRRTFYGACVVSATHLGGVSATFLASQYADQFRLIFFFAGLLGLLLLVFRSFMKESHAISRKKASVKNVSVIATETVKDKRPLLHATVIASTLVLVFYGSLIYLNEFMHQNLGISRSQIFKGNTVLLLLWVILPPCFGYMIDRLNLDYRKIMKIGAAGVFLISPLLGLSLGSSSYFWVLITQICLHVFHMLFCLCTPRFFGELFSEKVRNTAVSTTYSLGSSFTSALAPALCYGSVVIFDSSFFICLPFMGIACLTLILLKRKSYATR